MRWLVVSLRGKTARRVGVLDDTSEGTQSFSFYFLGGQNLLLSCACFVQAQDRYEQAANYYEGVFHIELLFSVYLLFLLSLP